MEHTLRGMFSRVSAMTKRLSLDHVIVHMGAHVLTVDEELILDI
jgi:hypothetical protein